jgi:hypothetical protein
MQYYMLVSVCGDGLLSEFPPDPTLLTGWLNLIQKGYLHRDISIGNLVMVEDAVTTKAFEILKTEGGNATVENITETLQDLNLDSSTWESRLTTALHDLGITDKSRGFMIDSDMIINMADYFNKEHPGSRSPVRWKLETLLA